jgi:hypothetical protein
MFLLMGKALGPDSSLKGVDLCLASCTRRTSDAALPLRTKLRSVARDTRLRHQILPTKIQPAPSHRVQRLLDAPSQPVALQDGHSPQSFTPLALCITPPHRSCFPFRL